MPRGIPNKKPADTPPAQEPHPLILLQPAGDAWRIDAYGLDAGKIIDGLRLALLHLVATHSGATVLSATISRRDAVLAPPPTPRANGAQPEARASKRAARSLVFDDVDDVDDVDQADLLKEPAW